MKTNPHLERAQSYLSINLASHPRTPSASPTALPFITLSRQAGAGASTLAHLITPTLNRNMPPEGNPWRVYDGNLVEAMLSDGDQPDHLARYLPEDTLSEVDASIGEILGLHPNLWGMIQKTNELIRRLAQRGNCILIGRAANFVTSDLPNGLHVRLIGRADDRMEHMAQTLKISRQAARLRNQRRDAERRRYVKGHFNQDVSDPRNYDLVCNTSTVSLNEAARILTSLVGVRTPVPAA